MMNHECQCFPLVHLDNSKYVVLLVFLVFSSCEIVPPSIKFANQRNYSLDMSCVMWCDVMWYVMWYDFLLFEAFFDFDIFTALIWRYYYYYYSPLTFEYHSLISLTPTITITTNIYVIHALTSTQICSHEYVKCYTHIQYTYMQALVHNAVMSTYTCM